jgi:uncharacterized membrane protein
MITNQKADNTSPETSHESIGVLLRVGVTIAALLVIAGGALYLVRTPDANQSTFSHFQGESAQLWDLFTIFAQAFHGNARAIIQAGILVLIATPVARVIFAGTTFARQRDWVYVIISGIVLVILLFSIVFL